MAAMGDTTDQARQPGPRKLLGARPARLTSTAGWEAETSELLLWLALGFLR